uniref:hypothetical protein n=1 Tax=Kitasatospora sp. NBC_01519 TaxID=2903576 RepID=UPI002F9164D8
MTRPDPYDVLTRWLAAGLGKHGRALQGTTPTRYEADLRDWLYFTQETTGIGAWNADESTATTWAYAPALRRPNPDRPSRRPLAPRVPLHNPARRLAALAAFYAYAADAGHIPEPPFNAAALRPAPHRSPWSRPRLSSTPPTTPCPAATAAGRTTPPRTATASSSTPPRRPAPLPGCRHRPGGPPRGGPAPPDPHPHLPRPQGRRQHHPPTLPRGLVGHRRPPVPPHRRPRPGHRPPPPC